MKKDNPNGNGGRGGRLPAGAKKPEDRYPPLPAKKAADSFLREYTEPPKEKRERGRIFDGSFLLGALTQITAVLLSFLLVVYFGYHLVRAFSSDITTSGVFTITEKETVKGRAVLIRDEKLLDSQSGGYIDPLIEEGRRVSKGEAVCAHYASDRSGIRAEIRKIEKEIGLLKRSSGAGASSVGVLDNFELISSGYSDIMKALSSEDYSAATAMSDDWRVSLERKEYLAGSGNPITARLISLESRVSLLEASMGDPLSVTRADEPGYYFSVSDGYESVFGPSLVKEFTESAFREAMAVPAGRLSDAGKLVRGMTWYLAVEFEGTAVGALNPGDAAETEFLPSGRTVKLKLEKNVRTETGIISLFSSDSIPEDFVVPRFSDVSVTVREFSGYRVPVTAVHPYEDMTGVFTLHGGYVYFRKINVLTEGPGYYIVSPYEEVEEGPPASYSVPRYDMRGPVCDYATIKDFCVRNGIKPVNPPRNFRQGDKDVILDDILLMDHRDPGTKVLAGQSLLHYYYLSGLEQIIISGSDLFHGKVLN
jgi:hypothetical protein